LTWKEIHELLLVLLPTLEAFHSLGVFHCDIQPANIIISALRPPVLVDFGAAICPSAGIKARPSTMVITAGFSPPELVARPLGEIAATAVGAWSDLFSVAAVAFLALSGRLPQIGNLGAEVNLLNSKHGAPAQLAAAIGWCLSIEPKARPQRAQDVINLLRTTAL
jgi:serine/threonine protein kinase